MQKGYCRLKGVWAFRIFFFRLLLWLILHTHTHIYKQHINYQPLWTKCFFWAVVELKHHSNTSTDFHAADAECFKTHRCCSASAYLVIHWSRSHVSLNKRYRILSVPPFKSFLLLIPSSLCRCWNYCTTSFLIQAPSAFTRYLSNMEKHCVHFIND